MSDTTGPLSDLPPTTPPSSKDFCPAIETQSHSMVSVKTASEDVPWVETCAQCGWIDGAALQLWADNARKRTLNDRAARIAIAIDTDPFAFVQQDGVPLTLSEVMGQALGAASACWENLEGAGVFDSSRAIKVYLALEREVLAFQAERIREALEAFAEASGER